MNSLGEDVVDLPPDFVLEIPEAPYKWVRQYLDPQELLEHFVGWSDQEQRLIFPVYDKRYKLLMWTGRYFGTVKGAPKYMTMGQRKEVIHVIPSNEISENLVLTEDIVSAIKVSRACSAMPLFGTNMPLEHARTLSKRFSGVYVWLDPDAKRQAFREALELSKFFERAKCIFSTNDPKAHTDLEISKYLGAV